MGISACSHTNGVQYHGPVRPAALFTLFHEAALAFTQDKVPRMAAAVAYYSLFSIAPMLLFALALASHFLSHAEFKDELLMMIASYLSSDVANIVSQLLPKDEKKDIDQLEFTMNLAGITGFGALFMASTGLFMQIKESLNSLWGADPNDAKGVWNIVKSRMRAFILVLVFGLVIIGFLLSNIYMTALGEKLPHLMGYTVLLTRTLTAILGVSVLTLLFAIIYKFLPNVRLQWGEVWIGAFITSVLFTLAQLGISWYLAEFAPASAFGTVSALVVVLIWMYFSAMIFFYGAEVTWVYSQTYGSGAGGAENVSKKEAMQAKGSHIDPTPTQQELEDAQRKPKRGALALLSRPKLLKVLPSVPTQEEGRLLPTVKESITTAITAVMAVPVVILFRLIGFTGGERKKKKKPKD